MHRATEVLIAHISDRLNHVVPLQETLLSRTAKRLDSTLGATSSACARPFRPLSHRQPAPTPARQRFEGPPEESDSEVARLGAVGLPLAHASQP